MLLPKVEKFLRTSGMPWTRFGRIVAHDPRLVSDLRNGRLPRPALAAKVERYIEDYIAANSGAA